MYTHMTAVGPLSAVVDFWWIKPKSATEPEEGVLALDRHDSGPCKNDPGKSRQVYAPFAALFGATTAADELTFGIEDGGGDGGGGGSGAGSGSPGGARAYVMPAAGPGQSVARERCYLVMAWQEAWTANPFARSKFIKGKLLYQRGRGSEGGARGGGGTAPFFACPFDITDGVVSVNFDAEIEVATALPHDAFKLGDYV